MPMTISTCDYLIDSNLLAYFVHEQSEFYLPSRKAVEILGAEGFTLGYCPQNAIESWAVATRAVAKGGLGYKSVQAEEQLEIFASRFILLAETADIFPQWQDVVRQHGTIGHQVFDARLAASMRLHQVPAILTKNTRDFRQYTFLRAIEPEEVLAGQR
jgi:predicted nucleic acid-binding protein